MLGKGPALALGRLSRSYACEPITCLSKTWMILWSFSGRGWSGLFTLLCFYFLLSPWQQKQAGMGFDTLLQERDSGVLVWKWAWTRKWATEWGKAQTWLGSGTGSSF